MSHPVAYFAALYRALAQHPRIDLTVYYESDVEARDYFNPQLNSNMPGDPSLLDGYRSVIFGTAGRERPLRPGWTEDCWRIAAPLWHGRYDAILLHGYGFVTNWIAMLVGLARGGTLLMREPPTLLEPRPVQRRLAKQLITRAALRPCRGLYVGTENRRYLARYGMPAERMALLPNAVDNAFFRGRATALAPRREELRARLGVDDARPLILYCGALVPWKQPLLLLEAFRRLRAEQPCALLFVGDGVLRPQIEAEIARHAIPDVHLAGYLGREQVCEAYAAADLLVLPSAREVWGLVVNEAMNFALPVVASDRVGAAADLIVPGENGSVFAHDDVEALASALRPLLADPERRRRYGARSLEIIAPWTVARGVENIVALIEAARAPGMRRRA